ncbi:MAG: GGDEF domain-containing protein [Myxococcales bacterium]|nr:GGDEF domain-containing protein [Myxococcales bacterium]MDD9968460.1 GGDEF domain-containing protein [Myxococcales bacterium]
MLRFGGKKGGQRASGTGGQLQRAFPTQDINEAFKHLLRLINRVAILAGASNDLTAEIASLRTDVGRATLPEDYEHLCDQVRALEFGSALSGLEATDPSGGLREAIDAVLPVARSLGADGPLILLKRLRKDAEHPRTDLPRDFHAAMERLAESVGWLRAASDVFKVSTLDLIATLSRLSLTEHGARSRLTQLRESIKQAGDLNQLQALRQALLEETDALVEQVANREARFEYAREQVDRVQAHVASLEGALADAHQMARTDPLTGLGNRRALEEAVARLADHSKTTGLVAVDIDHFKRVNDDYGHDAGDLVIRRLADVLRMELRGDDRAFRVGGEEFFVLLPATDASQAASVAERIRARFAAARVLYGDNEIGATLSAGASQWHQRQTFKAAAKRADELLYAAKSAGRNRVMH